MERIRLIRATVRFLSDAQFSVPEPLLWIVLVFAGGGAAIDFSEASLVFSAPFLVALVGVLRWRWHRRLSRGGLAITRFGTLRGAEGRGEQVQQIILTSLQDKLPSQELALVHTLPARVGTQQRELAIRLRRRLRARYLLHGRIEDRGSSYEVYARSAQPVDRGVTHVDWHTRDVTPSRARLGALIEILTPGISADVGEYPLEFTGELEAIVRGAAGQIAVDFEDWTGGERLLKRAVAVAPNSTSHQVDRLRADLAKALSEQGRRDEALSLLRERATGQTPSPYLLRRLFEVLGPRRGSLHPDWDEDERTEAVAALRKAAEYENDPQRDLTLYNLAQQLGRNENEQREAGQIREFLMQNSRYYRATWYLKREVGAVHYHHAQTALSAGQQREARQEYALAARWYSRAVRARPKVRFFEMRGPEIRLLNRYRPSATLLANTWDAHAAAGHRIRAWRYGRRTRREQRYLERHGMAYFRRSDWQAAEAYFDWGVVGYGDPIEANFLFYKALCLKQLGHDNEAEDAWSRALEAEPLALLARAAAAAPDVEPSLPAGVPGSEPTDLPTVIQTLEAQGVLAAHDDSSQ